MLENLNIIIPSKNEAKNLDFILPKLLKYSEDITVVDGNSNDGTDKICEKYNVKYVKDNLFSPPPIFTEIQKVSKTSPKEMHQVYNMGHRLEVFCKPELESTLINVAKEFEIEAQVVGRTEPSGDPSGKNQLEINLGDEILKYE